MPGVSFQSRSESGTSARSAAAGSDRRKEPVLILGVDVTGSSGNADVRTQRANAIRQALIDHGVPENRIKTGSFGDPSLRQQGRTEVLIRTGTGS